jgi:disulfide bond formation protein DsbB
METLLFFINKILAITVILSHFFLIASIVYFFILKKKSKKIEVFFTKNSFKIIFLISFISLLGSLFYSNIIGFTPCDLCWFQRIFMYPLVIISAIALLKKDDKGIYYIIPISVIGFFISIWHNYSFYSKLAISVCDSSGISCIKAYVLEFNYITIQMMALTAFSLIIFFSIFKKIKDKIK